MKKLIQFSAGCAAMFGVAPYLYGTPFNHVLIYGPLFLGVMYATAIVQAYAHGRFSSRGTVGTAPRAKMPARR